MKKFFTTIEGTSIIIKECLSRCKLGRVLLLASAMAICGIGLSSCYIDAGWDPLPPDNWNNTFYDSRLDGYWQLYTVNNRPASGDVVNYMYFNGDGRGRYYYYQKGMRYWENTAYWCQNAYSGNSNYQINLQYETSGNPTTMNYWFADGQRYLYLQWYNNYGWQTYVYVFYPYGAPW